MKVFDYPAHYQTLASGQNADKDTVDMILEGAAITAKTYFLHQSVWDDEEGCTF